MHLLVYFLLDFTLRLSGTGATLLSCLIMVMWVLQFDIHQILFRENGLYGRLTALDGFEFEEKVIFLEESFPWGVKSQAGST